MGSFARCLLIHDPRDAGGRTLVDMAFVGGGDPGDVFGYLAESAAQLLANVPRSFVCRGKIVGLLENLGSAAYVRGPVSLSCLSWFLSAKNTGLYLRLSEESHMPH